jgi:hypothetical protein
MESKDESQENSFFVLAIKLKDHNVINKSGEDLGIIEDLMIDLGNDRIAYAVLFFGGFLGFGNKLLAVPLQAFKFYEYILRSLITLDVEEAIPQKTEGFDKDKLPLAYEELLTVYTYYGYQPYWQTGEVCLGACKLKR